MYTLETKHYNWHILLKSTANTYINTSYFLKENGSGQNTMLKKPHENCCQFLRDLQKNTFRQFFLL